MFGKEPHLDPPSSLKQLLVAESELNRARLCQDCRALAHGVQDLAHRAKTLASWTSLALVLVAGVAAWRRDPSASSKAKSSLFQKILNGARLASAMWLALRAPGEKAEDK